MIFKILIPLLSFYVFLVVLVYLIQDKMLFFPDSTPLKNCSNISKYKATAESIEINDQTVNFYIRKSDKAKAWLIHFHGNAGRACDRDFLFQELGDLPLNIVLMEYPGYSGNKTKPSQKSFLANAELALDYFIKENDLPIYLFGESLGTGVATYLASKFKIKGLILQAAYPSLGEVGESAYPFLPVRLLIRNNFPAKTWAPQVNSKVIFLHGEDDNIIPLTLAKEQSKNFPPNFEFITYPNLGHNDLVLYNQSLWNKVRSFITN